MIRATIDTSRLRSFQSDLQTIIEENAIPRVAQTQKRIILDLTSQGLDAFGRPFHPYSKGHARFRTTFGYQVDVKNLRMTNDMLGALALRGDILSFSDDSGDKQMQKALGQQTGRGGKWSYVHDFVNVSESTLTTSADELAEDTIARLSKWQA